MSVTKVLPGDGIEITGADSEPIVNATGDMTAVNLKSSYQPAMMSAITSASKFTFIGDSITYGLKYINSNIEVQADYRWSKLLSDNYDVIEENLAIIGSNWQDQLVVFYNSFTIDSKPTNPLFLACGINDLSKSDTYNQDAIISNAISTIIYATLPSTSFKFLRIGSPDIKDLKGLWKDNILFKNFGLLLASDGKKKNGGSLEVEVTGRYIVINCSSFQEAKNSWIVYIDGEKVDIFLCKKRLSGALYPLDMKCWIYDTESSPGVKHTVKIEAIMEIYSIICVDYIAGFDESQINCSPVFVSPVHNIANIASRSYPAAYSYRMSYNEGLKITCRMLRNVYKLPVYYMEDVTNSYGTYGNITSPDLDSNLPLDGVHPGKKGHKWIFDRIVNFLENGEYVFRETM